MGFIERLKQQKETETQASIQHADEADGFELVRTASEDREFHLKRNQQALAIRKDSGVGLLVITLSEIVSRGNPFFNRPEKLPTSLTDPDSTFDIVLWDVKYHGESSRSNYIRDYSVKFLVVESAPDGDVVFHTNAKVIIQEQAWRTNSNILEEALEKAFNEPRTHRYSINTWKRPTDQHFFPFG